MMVMVVMMVVKVRMEWNACITCRAIRIPLGILVHPLLIIRVMINYIHSEEGFYPFNFLSTYLSTSWSTSLSTATPYSYTGRGLTFPFGERLWAVGELFALSRKILWIVRQAAAEAQERENKSTISDKSKTCGYIPWYAYIHLLRSLLPWQIHKYSTYRVDVNTYTFKQISKYIHIYKYMYRSCTMYNVLCIHSRGTLSKVFFPNHWSVKFYQNY